MRVVTFFGFVLYNQQTKTLTHISTRMQAQRIDPMSSEVTGPIGLVPSRQRLERRERVRSRHVNFLARAGRSTEPGSLEHARSSGNISANDGPISSGSTTTHRRDHSLGMAVSVTSLASSGTKHPERRGKTKASSMFYQIR